MIAASMSVSARDQALAQLSEPQGVDVLVIGGGVTGAGIALDAVTRGMSVGIIEAQDWASGTSSRSSKLVHGGLRYLQMLDFHLVHEALVERDLLATHLAPHLVRPVSFLYPLKTPVIERFYVGAGVGLYDALATARRGRRAMPFHRHVSRAGLTRMFPDMRQDVARGAVLYWDARVDDARLVTTLVRTAASFGAMAASRTKVTDITRDGAGRVDGVRAVDLESGQQLRVRARHVINATGVWTEETEALATTDGGLQVLASKGVHIVVPKERIDGKTGIILQTEKSVLFIIPWERYWVIGTTDTPWHEPLRHPVATATDIQYVIDHANQILNRPISRDDVIGVWAGLRPLLQPGTKGDAGSTKVSREHTCASPVPGLTVIAGGKLTTYRVMAKDAVDFALGPDEARRFPSITERVPLLGAGGYGVIRRQRRRIGHDYGWDADRVDHLIGRYGSDIVELLSMIDDDASLGRPLNGAEAYLRVEALYAVTHEGALHLEDVLRHRTRIHHEQVDRGTAVAQEIAELIAPHLGWSAAEIEAEVATYRAAIAAELAAEQEPDDASAARARLAAPEITQQTV